MKKIYEAPEAELVTFAPVEGLASVQNPLTDSNTGGGTTRTVSDTVVDGTIPGGEGDLN